MRANSSREKPELGRQGRLCHFPNWLEMPVARIVVAVTMALFMWIGQQTFATKLKLWARMRLIPKVEGLLHDNWKVQGLIRLFPKPTATRPRPPRLWKCSSSFPPCTAIPYNVEVGEDVAGPEGEGDKPAGQSSAQINLKLMDQEHYSPLLNVNTISCI